MYRMDVGRQVLHLTHLKIDPSTPLRKHLAETTVVTRADLRLPFSLIKVTAATMPAPVYPSNAITGKVERDATRPKPKKVTSQ